MSDSTNQNKIPTISIGLPVFNGSKFLKQRIDSIINQTFEDFELIISDNASTDSTQTICEEFAKNDKRILYIRQAQNKGPIWNFNFVTKQASGEFFCWVAVDDLWLPEFLEKNLQLLNTQKNVVGCISKIKFYDIAEDNDPNKIVRGFTKKIRSSLKPAGVYSITGTFEERVRKCLARSKMNIIYGVFRASALQNSVLDDSFVGIDLAIILNILKHGDFFALDEILMQVYGGGLSKRGYLGMSKLLNHGIIGIAFPCFPLTKWCLKNLGTRIFFKNITYFVQLNLWAEFLLAVDAIRLFYLKFK